MHEYKDILLKRNNDHLKIIDRQPSHAAEKAAEEVYLSAENMGDLHGDGVTEDQIRAFLRARLKLAQVDASPDLNQLEEAQYLSTEKGKEAARSIFFRSTFGVIVERDKLKAKAVLSEAEKEMLNILKRRVKSFYNAWTLLGGSTWPSSAGFGYVYD